MPCDDVTETLRLELDDADRLVGYQLIKRTCGRAVGERTLLAAEFVGMDAADVLELDAGEFAEASAATGISDEELFLRMKHFFAVQGGLRVLLGRDSGGLGEPVTVARISLTDQITTFDADIAVEVLTEQIKSCGKCKGCGSLAKKITAAAGTP